MIGVSKDDRQYRRGVVLGLTMAEILLLLIFVLMLLLVSKLREEIAAAVILVKERDAAILQLSELQELVGYMRRQGVDEFDIMKDYVRVKNELDAAQRRLKDAAPALSIIERAIASRPEGTPEGAAADLLREASAGRQVLEEAQRAYPNMRPEDAVQAMLTNARTVQALNLEPGGANELLDQAASCRADLQNCQGQSAFLNQQLNEQTGGRDMPPCWADAAGNIEYIFDAHLKDAGIVLVDNKIPNRAVEQAELPIAAIRFDVPLEAGDLLTTTKAIYDHSVEHQCRFYVRLNDEVGSGEGAKDRYKALRKAVEGHFYILNRG